MCLQVRLFLGLAVTGLFVCSGGTAFAGQDTAPDREPLVVEARYDYFSDSDDTRINSVQQSGVLPLNEHLKWSASYTRSRYSEPNILSSHENKYSTGFQYAEGGRTWDALYGVRDFSDQGASHVYKLSASLPIGFLRGVTLTHEYDHWETARAVRARIKARMNSVGVYQPITGRWIATAYYQRHDFNDDNARDLFRQGILLRILRGIPELRLGYEFVYYNMHAPSPLYWSPDHLRIHQIKWMLLGNLWGSRWSYQFVYALGFARQTGEEDQTVNSGAAELTYTVNQAWEFFGHLDISVEPTYDSTLVRFGLRRRF